LLEEGYRLTVLGRGREEGGDPRACFKLHITHYWFVFRCVSDCFSDGRLSEITDTQGGRGSYLDAPSFS
jgi:hypothetical protein